MEFRSLIKRNPMPNQHTKQTVLPSPLKPSPLISAAHDLQGVKNKLDHAKERQVAKEAEYVESVEVVSALTAQHKELQAKLASEALLIKPE